MILVLLLAAFVRVHRLGAQSLWLDELLQVETARLSLAEIIPGVHAYSAMPLDYFVTHGALWLGAQDFWLRFPAVLWSLLSVAVLYRLVARLVGSREALIAAGLLAVAPFAVRFAQEARPYALWGLLSLVSFLCLLAALQTDRLAHWAGFSLASALALFTHLFTLFTLGAQAFIVLLTLTRRHARSRGLRFITASLLATSVLFATPYPVNVWGVGEVFAASLLRPASFTVEAALKPNRGTGPILDASFFQQTLLAGLGGEGGPWPWLFVVLALAGLLIAARRQARLALMLAAWGLAPIVVTIAFFISRGTFFAVRYVTPSYFALVIAAALGLAGLLHATARLLSARGASLFAGAVMIATLAFNAISLQAYAQTHKEDWRIAGHFVNANLAADDVLVSPLSGFVIAHYAPRARAHYADVALPEALPPSFARLWFVRHPYLDPAGPAWEAWLAARNDVVEYQVDESLSLFVVGVPKGETLARVAPPETALAYAALAAQYERLDQFAEAEAHFQRALRLSPAPEFKTRYADFLRRAGQIAQSAELYRQALEIDSAHVPALIGLGRLALQRGAVDEAVRALEQAARQAPDDYAAHFFLAQAYARLGRIAEAEQHRQRASQIVPDLIEPP